jgi:integrase/recombinase XerD
MKVHLRQRKQTKQGGISLFLEIYKGTTITPDGKIKNVRDYEYLNLYLIDKPKNPVDKQHNKETLQLAESIKAKREIEIKNGLYGFTNDFKQSTNFIDYFKAETEKRKESTGNYGNWDSTLKHLIKYAGTNITFRDIDDNYCEGFKEYLNKKAKKTSGQPLSSASVSSYYTKFRACLKKAVKDKVILSNPSSNVSTPRVIENVREWLTIEEVRSLAKTDCRYEVLKRAFLFACLTGLRWSDIHKLQWSEVQRSTEGWRIVFHQQKTKGLQYLDISDQAKTFLGNEGQPSDRVFTGLKYSSYTNVELTKWMLKAGITKNITFHCSRHSYAALHLEYNDNDIYMLSKLLGHSNLKTTEIYAKMFDKKKREAVNKIPNISIF